MKMKLRNLGFLGFFGLYNDHHDDEKQQHNDE